ncbi:AI-2E family transporter [Propionicicella superfundia]|uniref:AI-2E family transporter n=1 Tax=Propionicicella superfundia TaxID=348582 RepID=UPI0003FE1E6F|nr:AI-2E family transporter [Propionicicella superfundia]
MTEPPARDVRAVIRRIFLRPETPSAVTPDDTGDVEPPPPPGPRSTVQLGFGLGIGLLLAAVVGVVAYSLQQLVLMIVAALFVALGLNPAVEWLASHRLPRAVAVLIVVLGMIILIGLGLWAIAPVAAEQIQLLMLNAPTYLNELRANDQIADLDERYHIISQLTSLLTSSSLITSLFGGILGASQILVNALASIIITMVLTIYFLASMPSVKQVVYRLAPASRRARVRYLADEMFARLGGYLSGVFIVVLCVSAFAFVYMSIIGLGRYALALTVVVAIFALIPLVGNTISMIVISIVAFSQSPVMGLVTIIVFLLYQQFDAYFIQPRVFARSMNVPGPLVIIAVLAGGTLLGVVGALLAVPMAAVLLLLYREVVIPALDRR